MMIHPFQCIQGFYPLNFVQTGSKSPYVVSEKRHSVIFDWTFCQFVTYNKCQKRMGMELMQNCRKFHQLILLLALTVLGGPLSLAETACDTDHTCCIPAEQISCCTQENHSPAAPADHCRCTGHGGQPTSAATQGGSTRLARKSVDPPIATAQISFGKFRWSELRSIASSFSLVDHPSTSLFRLTLRWRC